MTDDAPLRDQQPDETPAGLLIIHARSWRRRPELSLIAGVGRMLDGALESDQRRLLSALNLGHAWVEYRTTDGETRTFGTWELGQNCKPGLQQNMELRLTVASDVWRPVRLNRHQESILFATIEDYRAMGPQAWTKEDPCSTFVAAVSERVLGEKLEHRHPLSGWSNPSTLAKSIRARNHSQGEDRRPSLELDQGHDL